MDISRAIFPWARNMEAARGLKGEVSELGHLMRTYGVGNIPIEALHAANSVGRTEWDERRLRAEYIERKRAAARAEMDRHDEWAAEYDMARGK